MFLKAVQKNYLHNTIIIKALNLILITLLSCSFLYSKEAVAISPSLNLVVYPVMSPRLSSSFGLRKHPIRKTSRHHSGLDLAAPKGSAVRTVADGTVIFADYLGHYGNLVVIKHNNNTTTHYGHLSEVRASIGKNIKAGEIIGLVGSTGLSTGPHLHFELRKDGVAVNPSALLKDLSIKAEG